MKTIINNSSYVITVSNRYFSKDVAINETLTISDEEINSDYFFEFKFFSLKQKNENKIELEQTFGNRFVLWFSSTTYVPVQTKICVKKYDDLAVELKCAEFIFLSKLFKKICIQKLSIEDCNTKQVYSFVDQKYKKKFKLFLLIELLITVPISFILSWVTLISFIEAWGLFEIILSSVLTIFSIYSNVRKLYYLTCQFKKQYS